MRLFALETNKEKIISQFCHDHGGECAVLITRYHGLSFLFAIARDILITGVLGGMAIAAWMLNVPMVWALGILGAIWFISVPVHIAKAYIDWVYDFIVVTTDKVIFVDQTSIFKREVMPIHIENIGGISSFTQYWNIFPFGGLSVHLKEGRGGEDITKLYVPHAQQVASKISDVVTKYQRHQYRGDAESSTHASEAQQAAAAKEKHPDAHLKPLVQQQPNQTPVEVPS